MVGEDDVLRSIRDSLLQVFWIVHSHGFRHSREQKRQIQEAKEPSYACVG